MAENNNRLEIGQRMQKIRKEQRMSANDFAELLNIKSRTYSSYERGEAYPSIEFLITFINKFNLSAEWLLLGKGSEQKSADAIDLFKEKYSLNERKIKALQELLETPEAMNILKVFLKALNGDKDAFEIIEMINNRPSLLKMMYSNDN